MLPQRRVKDPGHSAKSAGGRLQLNTHTPFTQTKSNWADCAAVQALHGNLSGNKLTRNLSGNNRPQSTELARPLWTDPGIKSGTIERDPIATSEKEKGKKAQAGNELSSILPKSSHARKEPASHHHSVHTVKANFSARDSDLQGSPSWNTHYSII